MVDDGSIDESVLIAKKFPEVKLIQNPKNRGYGYALKKGFYAATNDCVITIDADGTYPIEKISDLINEFNNGFDLVIGARTGINYNKTIFRTILRKIFRTLVFYITGEKISDPNSGLRVFRKSSLSSHIDSFCNGYSFSTTSTVILILNGYHVTTLPIDYYFRMGKSKVKLCRDALRTLQILISCFLNYNPIKVFLPLFFLWFVLGALSLFLNTLIGVLLISFSFLFLGFGFLADILINLSKNHK